MQLPRLMDLTGREIYTKGVLRPSRERSFSPTSRKSVEALPRFCSKRYSSRLEVGRLAHGQRSSTTSLQYGQSAKVPRDE